MQYCLPLFSIFRIGNLIFGRELLFNLITCSMGLLMATFIIYLVVAPTPSGSYGDFQLLPVEEDPTCTNIQIFACMDRTTNTPQVSWKSSPHGIVCTNRVLIATEALRSKCMVVLANLKLNCLHIATIITKHDQS